MKFYIENNGPTKKAQYQTSPKYMGQISKMFFIFDISYFIFILLSPPV
jgi:hypothetical protein